MGVKVDAPWWGVEGGGRISKDGPHTEMGKFVYRGAELGVVKIEGADCTYHQSSA